MTFSVMAVTFLMSNAMAMLPSYSRKCLLPNVANQFLYSCKCLLTIVAKLMLHVHINRLSAHHFLHTALRCSHAVPKLIWVSDYYRVLASLTLMLVPAHFCWWASPTFAKAFVYYSDLMLESLCTVAELFLHSHNSSLITVAELLQHSRNCLPINCWQIVHTHRCCSLTAIIQLLLDS